MDYTKKFDPLVREIRTNNRDQDILTQLKKVLNIFLVCNKLSLYIFV